MGLFSENCNTKMIVFLFNLVGFYLDGGCFHTISFTLFFPYPGLQALQNKDFLSDDNYDDDYDIDDDNSNLCD